MNQARILWNETDGVFLFTAAQMSKTEFPPPPQPIKNLAVLGRSGNVHLKKKTVLFESTQICVRFLLKLS